MEIYLPVAQLAVNSFVLLGIGLAVGFLSGMLGVSGGFITTPLLIFYGIPSGIAVASQASPIAAASLVGAIRQGGKKSVDYKMGLWLLLGGLAGSAVGVSHLPPLAASRPNRFHHPDQLPRFCSAPSAR